MHVIEHRGHAHALARGELCELRVHGAVVDDHALAESLHARAAGAFGGKASELHLREAAHGGERDELLVGELLRGPGRRPQREGGGSEDGDHRVSHMHLPAMVPWTGHNALGSTQAGCHRLTGPPGLPTVPALRLGGDVEWPPM